jgi:hypothetical protein
VHALLVYLIFPLVSLIISIRKALLKHPVDRTPNPIGLVGPLFILTFLILPADLEWKLDRIGFLFFWIPIVLLDMAVYPARKIWPWPIMILFCVGIGIFMIAIG